MTRRSPLVRRLAPVAAVLVLSTPALASCGFDYATNRVNLISHDVNDRGGELDAIGVVLVSAQPGSGTLVTTFVNQDPTEVAVVESVTGTGEPVVDATGFEPIEVKPLDRYTAAEDGGIPVQGDFVPGEFVPIQFTYGDGSTADLDVPVVPGCRQWEGIDSSAQADSLQPEAAAPEVEQPGGEDEFGEPGKEFPVETNAWSCDFPEPFHH